MLKENIVSQILWFFIEPSKVRIPVKWLCKTSINVKSFNRRFRIQYASIFITEKITTLRSYFIVKNPVRLFIFVKIILPCGLILNCPIIRFFRVLEYMFYVNHLGYLSSPKIFSIYWNGLFITRWKVWWTTL